MDWIESMNSCWKWKLLHLNRSNFQQLISQGDSSAESSSNLESENFNSVGSSDKLRVRPRSAGDITESLRTGDVVIVQESVVASTESPHLRNVQQNHLQSSNYNNNSNSSTVSGGGGGLLSFFGVRFHKSGTRHLDRSSGDRTNPSDLGDKPRKTVSDRDRYTKFPLTSPSQQLQLLPQPGIVNSNVPLHTDSPFDATHIQLTPQTKTYAHPHKSPVPPVKGIVLGTTNPNKFLAHAVSSLGRKSKDCCCTISDGSTTRTHQKRNKQLKVKSKSDNSLHKVTLNNVATSSGNNTSTTTTVRSVLSPDFYPQGEQRLNSVHTSTTKTVSSVLSPDFYPQGEQRLNSVQLGDHATIRLPWTGFQPQNLNNLSSVTPTRTHPNTHNNHLLDLDSVRYVECGVWSGTHSVQPTSTFEVHPSSRRRSRSLERSSNFRIFPITHSISQNNRNNSSDIVGHSHLPVTTPTNVKSFSRQSNSLERPSRHRVRQSLSPSEQEILLRNLASYNNNRIVTEAPPPLPKKKSKPPPLGRLHSSAPNSSFSSVESSSSDSRSDSAPPSPPPRPLSTLRPESRLIISSTTTNKTQQQGNKTRQKARESQDSNIKSSNNNNNTPSPTNSATMNNSNVDRRPVVPRSQDHRTSPVSPDTTQDLGVAESTAGAVNASANSASAMSLEEARNSGFINKPSKGWLHSDKSLSKEGVTYTVRYIGCLDVNTSMKSLDFDTRSLIAKECINLVCEAAGLKSVDKKRKTDRRVARILGLKARLDQAGSDVHLTITSTCLKLSSLDTGTIIATHDLPNISFASGGDATMLDFVAYVAKDSVVGRACFVLECGSGRAQDVITTVGQAFELRFKEYLQKRPQPPPRGQNEDPEREYYNDLPGKVPPEVSSTTFVRGGMPVVSAMKETGKSKVGGGRAKGTPTLTLPTSSPSDNKDVISVNLIDFEAPTPPAFGPSTQDKNLEALLLSGGGTMSATPHEDGHGNGLSGSGLISPGHTTDPFNMKPFVHSLPNSSTPLSPADQRAQLETESWFHGVISRGEAEALVQNDGDFLVRESQATPGQYVLTGLQSGTAKHLLLVDPEGVVRTKDREFDSVIHLIRYHSDNSLPIISATAESMLLLRNPINSLSRNFTATASSSLN